MQIQTQRTKTKEENHTNWKHFVHYFRISGDDSIGDMIL